MSDQVSRLSEQLPDFLNHSDEEAPLPTWRQVTRSLNPGEAGLTAQVSRIVAGTEDEPSARSVWRSWPANYRRSVALLIDKIYDEGWLDLVGPIEGWPWDGGFFFRPQSGPDLRDLLDSSSGRNGRYTAGRLSSGLFAYLNTLNHKSWRRSWMENDTAMAALHIGVFQSGTAEVHLEAFNPLFTNGAPRSEVVDIPLIGSYNRRLYRLHRRWEQSGHAAAVRRSANFYHMMRGRVPLSF